MKRLIIIVWLFMAGQATLAGVDPRHGVFYMSYTDIEFPGGKTDISRSYHSNRSTTGLFGYGWASIIETKLAALPDGTLSLHWWGNSSGDYYEPAVIDRRGQFNMVNAIIKHLVKNQKLDNNPAAIAEKKSYYLINNKERASKYMELVDKKLAAAFIPPKAQQWVLDVNQVIEYTGRVFKVKSWDDSYEFNPAGQLVLIRDRNYKMQLDYRLGKLSRITVDDSSTCLITTDAKGRIVELNSALDGQTKKAIYSYDSTDNLIYSKDAGDNEYRYSYDLYHNMVKINYVDSTWMGISYDGASNRVVRLRDTKGYYTTYQYPYFYTAEGRINYDHYATRLQQYDSLGKLIFSSYKEYENRENDDGSTYMHRVLETSDTSYHEILYAREVGNASYRKKNNNEAWSSYDSKRRPVYLRLKDSIYRTSYTISGLPESFTALDSAKQTGTLYRYSYDKNDVLYKVQKNDDLYMFTTAGNSKTVRIIKNNTEELSIHYANNQPHYISHPVLGQLLVKDTEALIQKNDTATQNETTAVISKNQQQLIALYQDFSDILKPKKIEHEWIWQRL